MLLQEKNQDFFILEINIVTVISGLIISWFILSLVVHPQEQSIHWVLNGNIPIFHGIIDGKILRTGPIWRGLTLLQHYWDFYFYFFSLSQFLITNKQLSVQKTNISWSTHKAETVKIT